VRIKLIHYNMAHMHILISKAMNTPKYSTHYNYICHISSPAFLEAEQGYLWSHSTDWKRGTVNDTLICCSLVLFL